MFVQLIIVSKENVYIIQLVSHDKPALYEDHEQINGRYVAKYLIKI